MIVQEGLAPVSKTIAMNGVAATLSNPSLYKIAGKAGRWVIKNLPFIINNKLNAWYKQRDMPVPPKESFGEWFKKNR